MDNINNTTSYHDLTTYGKWLIDIRIKQELRDWKKCSIWWKKLDSDACHQMLAWFREFIQFRRKVLDGHSLHCCLQEWVKCNEPVFSHEFMRKINAPQLAFRDAIREAMRELEISHQA
jgi:hypothetical protein